MLYRLGLQSRSKIDTLLEKYYASKNQQQGNGTSGASAPVQDGELTLQLVMDQEDFMQEIKSQNEKLYDFLSQDENLLLLLNYIILQPEAPEEGDTRNENFVKRIHRYPHFAFQVLQFYPELYLLIATKPRLLDALFSFLDTDLSRENPMLYTYWIKIMLRLVDYHPEPLFQYIMSQENDFILQHLFVHMSRELMVDFMLKLFMCDNFDWEHDQPMFQTPLRKFMMKSKGAPDLSRRTQSDLAKGKKDQSTAEKPALTYYKVAEFWLEQNALDRCLALMRPEYDEETHITVQYLLTCILRRSIQFAQPSKQLSRLNPLAQRLISKEFSEIYIRTILNFENSSVVSCGVELLSYYVAFCSANDSILQMDNSTANLWPFKLKECVLTILNELPSFVSILVNPPKVEPLVVVTTFGVLDPPLGEIRLKVIEFLSMLFHSPLKESSDALIENKVLETITDLFFHYEFNNLLHNQFLKIISYILSRDSTDLMQSLFRDCRIVERILEAHKLNEESTAKTGVRKGYMGHLITISNTIVTIANSQQEIQDTIPQSEDWQKFVQNDLAERNLMQTTTLGGSHPYGVDSFEMNDHFKDFDDEIDDNFYQTSNAKTKPGASSSSDDDDDDDFSDDTDSSDSSDDDTIIRRRDNSSDEENSPLTDESPVIEDVTSTLREMNLPGEESEGESVAEEKVESMPENATDDEKPNPSNSSEESS